MKDIMKIVKSLEESGLIIKGIGETIKNETKDQKGFLPMLLGTLAASTLESALTGRAVIRAGEGTVWKTSKILMSSRPLTNFEIQRYYENEHKFSCVYSRNSLSKIKDEANIINLDGYY